MPDILDTIRVALGPLVGFDTTLLHVVALSLTVSLSASVAAMVCGLPLGTALAVFRFRGRRLLILLANAPLGLPPIVVRLGLYLLLSRSGPLGTLRILFTPTAMIVAQFMLALPIVVALSHRAMVGIWRDYGDDLLVSGASRFRAIPHLLSIGRREALTASLAGFGRSVSEVGAILIVGGNIAGYTRTMTTTIVLETGEGNLAFALALGLVLIVISIAVNACAFGIEAGARRIIPRESCMASFRSYQLAILGTLALLVAYPMRVSAAEPQTILLASTTSVENSGLLARILPQFTKETGIEVRVIAQGTGQALATAAHGDVDLVLVHDPEAEANFMASGDGLSRQEIAWNDFIIVGPGAADPAHVAGARDAVAALTTIAAAKVPFISRGDKSGDALEKRLWKAAGLDPAAVGDGWYRDIGGGMGAALNAAAAMGAYTVSDRGTWLSFGNRGGMKIVLEGDPRLLNRYDVILLNPQTHPQTRAGAGASFRVLVGRAGRTGGDRRLHDRRTASVPSGGRPEAVSASWMGSVQRMGDHVALAIITARSGWHAAEIGGPIQSRALHCRPRSEPEAGDRHLVGTSASLRLVHSPIDEKVCGPFCNRSSDTQAGTAYRLA